jgi:hypothetical protein
MLNALLPGVRELRTPLTVGYLWMFFFWIEYPSAHGRWPEIHKVTSRVMTSDFEIQISRLFAFFGKPLIFAALSFGAYILGCLVKIPTDSQIIGASIGRLWPRKHLRSSLNEFYPPMPPMPLAILDAELLRDEHLYVEYDRLVSEADFRINLCPPICASAYVIWEQAGWQVGASILVVAALLFLQGASRLSLSRVLRPQVQRAAAVRRLSDRLVPASTGNKIPISEPEQAWWRQS